jgi:hypothetical protein
MPVAAAIEAEVLAGDPDPLEVLRCGEHLLNQLAVLVLDLPPLHQSPPCLGDPLGEAIAYRLQLTQVEYPWGGSDGIDAVGNLRVAESLSEDLAQLRFQAADLAPQLRARLALVDPGAEPGELLTFQQSGHLQKCSHAASRVAAAIHNASSTAIWGTPLTWTEATARRRVPCSTP